MEHSGSGSNVIELDKVYKTYVIGDQKVEALRGVDLKVKPGQVVAVTGRSGAGKSTLLHVIGTLDKPSDGRLVLNGADVSAVPDALASKFRNSTVGFVFQMNNLLNEFTALENVIMPGLIAGMKAEDAVPRAETLLKSVGLENRLQHRPGEMSGGEQQRVAIARALLMDPPIILADEPTGNLDVKTSEAVQELFLQLCEEFGTTMLLVTHDLKLAKKMPNHIVMEDGRVVEGSLH